ncbi:MAG: alpha/beta hydrolase [Candidatus Woesearchaeota archaeon]
MKRTIIRIILTLFTIYLLFGLYLFLFQRSLLYFPSDSDFFACPHFSEYEKIVFNNTRMFFRNVSDTVVIIYHGNAGSACDRTYLLPFFEGFSTIIVSYPGYDGDDRITSKDTIQKTVLDVVSFTDSFDSVIVYGESIGTGPASFHAKHTPIDGLILITPYTKLSDVMQAHYPYPAFLLRDNFSPIYYLNSFVKPTLVIHGRQDEIIPYRLSLKLYEAIPSEHKTNVLVDSVHNTILGNREVISSIDTFLRDFR